MRLPAGRLRLATRPDLTGSVPTIKTIGIVVVAAFADLGRSRSAHRDHGHLLANQIGRESWQSIISIFRPAILDRHAATVDGSQLR